MLNNTGITRDPTTPMKHAVTALAARPRRGTVATPTAHPVTSVLAARCSVALAPAHAAVTERWVGVAERRRVLVVDEISARRRPLWRVGRNQRQTASFPPVVAYTWQQTDEDICAKNSYIFVPSHLGLCPLDRKFAPLVILVQRYVTFPSAAVLSFST